MRDALIVSTARTPLGKSYRGAFNNTTAPTMAGWAIEEAVKRSGVDPNKVDDVIMGAALQKEHLTGILLEMQPWQQVFLLLLVE